MAPLPVIPVNKVLQTPEPRAKSICHSPGHFILYYLLFDETLQHAGLAVVPGLPIFGKDDIFN